MRSVRSALFLSLLPGIFLYLLLPAGVSAAEPTTLDIAAPASVEAGEAFTVTAHYRSNGTDLCGAVCTVSGGWFSHDMDDEGCYYSRLVSGPGSVGYYSITVTCQKGGYDTRESQAGISFEKRQSSISLSVSPSTQYAGEPVKIEASYVDEFDKAIYGAECKAYLRKDGSVKQTEKLNQVGSLYTGSVVPQETGELTVSVECTSGTYEKATASKPLTVMKRESRLSVAAPDSAYYGESISVKASYVTKDGANIAGTCEATFGGETSQMTYDYKEYKTTLKIPYSRGAKELKVRCSSVAYENAESVRSVSPNDRPAVIETLSPKGTIWTLYPTDRLNLRIVYTDSTSRGAIKGAACQAEIGKNSYQLEASGEYYIAVIGNLTIGETVVTMRCSKTFYAGASKSVTMKVVPIPIDIKFITPKTDFMPTDEIKIMAHVTDKDGKDTKTGCNARIDVFDLSFGSLVRSYSIPEMTTEGVLKSMVVENPGQPSRIMATIACGGGIYEEKTAYTELKVKILAKQTEEGLTMIMASFSIVLLVLILLIRKKLKII